MPPVLPPALTAHPALWQGRRNARTATIGTGFERLDGVLPGGGWPLGGLTELLTPSPGLGELSLLLPALAQLTRRRQWVMLVDPPWIPYAPAMHGHGLDLERVLLVRTRGQEESLWACEQALRGPQDGAVLGWLDGTQRAPGFTRLRRLQLAARAGRKLPFLFRSSAAAGQSSPATLRLHLQADARELSLRILKCRGPRPTTPVRLRRTHQETRRALHPACPTHPANPTAPTPHDDVAAPTSPLH